jgi:hypothetical protein
MERYVKLNLDIDLSNYVDRLLFRPGNPIYNPIEVDELCYIVPELADLSNKTKAHNIVLFKPKTMISFAGSFTGIHIDSSQNDSLPIDLGMNIPIENGTAMTTRWYKFSNIENSDFYWKYGFIDPLRGRSYEELIGNQVDSMVLDGPYLFNSGEPHNVDGRHSTVNRSMLSVRWWDIVNNRLVRWSERQRLIDIINSV